MTGKLTGPFAPGLDRAAHEQDWAAHQTLQSCNKRYVRRAGRGKLGLGESLLG